MPADITVPINQTAGDTFAGAPGAPGFIAPPAEDMHDLLDQLDAYEETVPGLAGRLDHDSVAIAGHSRARRGPAAHIRVHTPGAVLRP
jgi:predicted dienelactone hydrolase